MESKRHGRTLPAIINGLSAAQAQSQGFIGIASDADDASVANSESLFLGESDDESTPSRSRSGSPQNIQDINGQTTKLNPAATPFDPKPTTSTPTAPSTSPNPFSAAATFGKPSGAPLQTKSTPVFDFNSITTNQAAHNPFESKEPPKFNFVTPGKGTKAEESKGTPSVLDSRGPPKGSFSPSPFGPKAGANSNGPVFSTSAQPIDIKPNFGLPSTTISESIKAVSDKSSTSTVAAVPSKAKSVLDQATGSSAPHVFSFETSPLFGPVDTASTTHDSKANLLQLSKDKDLDVLAPQQKDAAITSPNLTTLTTSKSTPFIQLQPPSPPTVGTNLPQAAPLKFPVSNDTLLPTPKPQFNPRLSQDSPKFPSFTAPISHPSLPPPSTKTVDATPRPNSILEPSTSSPRASSDPPVVKHSGVQPHQEKLAFSSSQIDPKSVALDKLSELMLLEDDGIMQQFIRFTVEPIIKASIAQHNDNESWKEASQSSPSAFSCGGRMLIGNRGMSCGLIG